MKKALTVAIAVLLVALSVLPAFAESVQSPTAKPTKYVVTVDTSAGGGSADVKYEGEIGPDGMQKILLTASPEEGFVFLGWSIAGSYTPVGKLTDATLEVIASGDLTVVPTFAKKGSPEETKPFVPSEPGGDKSKDTGSKSPQTGSQDAVAYIILGVSALAVAAVVVSAKRRSAKK